MTRQLLAWRMRQLGTPVQVIPVGLDRSLRDRFAGLRIDRAKAWLRVGAANVEVEKTPELVAAQRARPNALWICDLLADEENPRGDIVAFSPPRSGQLAAPIPVEVPPAREE